MILRTTTKKKKSWKNEKNSLKEKKKNQNTLVKFMTRSALDCVIHIKFKDKWWHVIEKVRNKYQINKIFETAVFKIIVLAINSITPNKTSSVFCSVNEWVFIDGKLDYTKWSPLTDHKLSQRSENQPEITVNQCSPLMSLG